MTDELREQVEIGQHNKSGCSRFSSSYAHCESQSEYVQEVVILEYSNHTEEFLYSIQTLQNGQY